MSGVLQHSPADIIRYMMIDLLLGIYPTSTNAPWGISVDNTPENPDNAIVVYDTMPKYNGRSHHSGLAYEHYGMSIKIRAGVLIQGFQKCNQIVVALDSQVKRRIVTIPQITYLGFTIPSTQYMVHAMNRTYKLRGTAAYLYLGKERSQTNVNEIATTSQRPLFGLNYSTAITQL